jgi:hypothetical protein
MPPRGPLDLAIETSYMERVGNRMGTIRCFTLHLLPFHALISSYVFNTASLLTLSYKQDVGGSSPSLPTIYLPLTKATD